MTISVWNQERSGYGKKEVRAAITASKILSHSWAPRNFQRVKVGVGEKPKGWDLADYVLGHFSKEDRGVVDDALKRVAGAVELMVQGEVDQAMNQFN